MYLRPTVWPGEEGQSVKFLTMERAVAQSISRFIEDSLGNTNPYFVGLAVTQNGAGGNTANIGPGSLYQQQQIDPTAWPSVASPTLAADTTVYTLQGLSETTVATPAIVAPVGGSSGQSYAALLEAEIQVTDNANVNTPFYNSSNPNSPNILPKSPSRQNVITYQWKYSAWGASPTVPTADSGFIPIASVVMPFAAPTTILTANITTPAAASPVFYGFVQINPNGNTPVFLSPASQQTGFINIGSTTGSTLGKSLTINDASGSNVPSIFLQDSGSTVVSLAYAAGAPNVYTVSVGSAPFKFKSDGTIDFSNGHAMTDVDPGPSVNANVTMLGGKVASDYALAAGSYVTLFAGTPTLGTGNAGVTGYLQSGVATGTAPFVVASTTEVVNLNANFVGGFAAGNASGNVPVSNGTLNVNLNAQFLNGLASSAYQPAGNYATMNATNTGTFSATGAIAGTGGTGSSQIVASYAATNSFGINGGNNVGYIQAPNYPLGLIASSIRTNCPLIVGDSQRQNISFQDAIASGLIRSGLPCYRVTKAAYNPNAGPFPVGTSGAVDWGYWVSPSGQITLSLPGAASWDFRMVVTLNTSLTVNFNGRYNDAFAVWVDGANVYSGSSESIAGSYTFTSGTHTIDFIYGADGLAGDDKLDLFGWIPFPSGGVSAAITSIVPG